MCRSATIALTSVSEVTPRLLPVFFLGRPEALSMGELSFASAWGLEIRVAINSF